MNKFLNFLSVVLLLFYIAVVYVSLTIILDFVGFTCINIKVAMMVMNIVCIGSAMCIGLIPIAILLKKLK